VCRMESAGWSAIDVAEACMQICARLADAGAAKAVERQVLSSLTALIVEIAAQTTSAPSPESFSIPKVRFWQVSQLRLLR